MDEPSRRTQLADRFANYPLISMFILSPAFPLTVAGLMILAGLIALCIPKLWVTTPPGFSPKIKVSVLDLAQAAVLRNRARKHEAAGDFERAHHAWQSAIANNGGDVGLLADSLKNLLRIHNPPREFIETAVSQALWFMRLTGTNDLALDIVPAVFVKCRIPEYTVSILRRFDPPLPPVRETAMLKALFLTGRIDEYHRRKEEFGKSLPQDPELDLCEAGYVAGWGPPEKSQQALRAISEGMEDRNLYEFAARVQLVVATKTHDIARYEAALNRLRENETDSLTDHVGYWKLLEAAGRQAEARQLAQSYPKVPSSAMEA
ncbi:MAG: hypothetical protein N3G20_11665, partial [Verrucomicrobiae bacterium]|nr:hypothetical protein [Verrucomicrobiae bacterium]